MSEGKSPTDSLIPSTIHSKTKRKNMYSVISCRALLKKAREIDPKDPLQSYLPAKKRSPMSKMTSKSPRDNIKRSTHRNSQLTNKESPRILIQSNINAQDY